MGSAASASREPKLPATVGDGVFVVRRLRPSGVLSLFRGGVLTAAHAALITERVMALSAAFSEPNRMIIVHDWRAMTNYESAARTDLTKWAVAHFREIAFTGIVIPEGNRIINMGLQVAASALALSGMRLEVDTSVPDLLARSRLSLT
jgi:hypothetical protein